MYIGLRKWGNSAAIRIPNALIKALHLEPDQFLDARVEDGTITLRPVTRETRQRQIQQLRDRLIALNHYKRPLPNTNEIW